MEFNICNHILLEDDYLLVINKPAGLMVEPDRNNHPNLLQLVKNYLRSTSSTKEEIYAQHIHRLDRPVSGVILFAKQRTVLKNLSEQFAERKVKKYYNALTADAPQQLTGTLEQWHRKEKKKAALYSNEIEYSEKAILIYKAEPFSENKFLWSIELQTGKFHQIRAQLASIHCPIIGDELYGSSVPYKPNAIALHANKLVFFHPFTNTEVEIFAENSF